MYADRPRRIPLRDLTIHDIGRMSEAAERRAYVDSRHDRAGDPNPATVGKPPVREPSKVCGFCQGRPVHDARSMLDDKPRPPLPCPRCGEINEEE